MPAPAPASAHSKTGLPVLGGCLAGLTVGALLRFFANSPADGSRAEAGTGAAAHPAPSVRQPDGDAPLSAAAQARLDAFLNAGTPGGQIAAALALGEAAASADEIRALLKQWRRFPDNAPENTAIAALLRRWLELDRPGALEYCRRVRPEFLSRLVVSWSREHPTEAAAWVRTLPPGESQSLIWGDLCTAMAGQDSGKALEMLARFPALNASNPGYAAMLSIRQTMAQLARRGVEKLIGALDTLPPAFAPAARDAIARQLSLTDPARAWRWARDQPEAAKLTADVLTTILEKNPGQALEFLRTLPTEESRKTAMSTASGAFWRVRDPRGFAVLLGQAAHLDSDARQAMAATLLQTSDYAAATAFIPLLKESRLPELIGPWMTSWLAEDHDAAAAWAGTLPEGPVRAAATRSLAAWTPVSSPPDRTSPESLAAEIRSGGFSSPADSRLDLLTVNHLNQIMSDPGPRTDESVSRLLNSLGAVNPKVAADWLENTVIHDKTGPLAARFSASWAENDPAAAWVKSLPPGPLAETAARNVAFQFHRHAPAEAMTWAAALTDAAARRAALQKIISATPPENLPAALSAMNAPDRPAEEKATVEMPESASKTPAAVPGKTKP